MTDFDRGIYALAWRAFRSNFTAFAGIALAVTAIDSLMLISGRSSSAGVDFVISALISLWAHLVLLLADQSGAIPATTRIRLPFIRFVWSSALLAAPAGLAFVVLMLATGGSRGAAALALAGSTGVFAVTLALLGTILPAVALGGKIDPAAAFRRGLRAFWPTLGSLAAGPAAFWVLLIIAQVALAAGGAPPAAYDPATGEMLWLGGAAAVLVMSGVVFASLLGAAVLCKTYYRGGGSTA